MTLTLLNIETWKQDLIKHVVQLHAVDHSAHRSMKNVANYENRCELQDTRSPVLLTLIALAVYRREYAYLRVGNKIAFLFWVLVLRVFRGVTLCLARAACGACSQVGGETL